MLLIKGSELYSFGVTRPLLDGFLRTPSQKYASEKSTFLIENAPQRF